MKYIEMVNTEIESYTLTPVRKTVIELNLPIFDNRGALIVFQDMLNSYVSDSDICNEYICTVCVESKLTKEQLIELETMASDLIKYELKRTNLTVDNSVTTAKVYERPHEFILVLETSEI